MGKLLEAIAKHRMNAKLKRGRCLNCNAILPDNHPAEAEQACSDECSNEVLESRQW